MTLGGHVPSRPLAVGIRVGHHLAALPASVEVVELQSLRKEEACCKAAREGVRAAGAAKIVPLVGGVEQGC